MKDKFKIINGIKYNYLRQWQQGALEKTFNEQYSIINAMTGSGKSSLIITKIYSELLSDSSKKAIIVVPQEIITTGFIQENIILLDETYFTWHLSERNILIGNALLNKGALLMDFLTSEGNGSPSDRTILTSHLGLVLLMDKIEISSFDNISFYIDEAHHISSLFEKENKLGVFIKNIIYRNKSAITLTTATFYRGDKIPILTEEQKQIFVRYDLPVDQYMESLNYLRDIKIEIILYDTNDPMSVLAKDIQKYGVGKKIIYLPHILSSEMKSFGTKQKWVKSIQHILAGSNGQCSELDENGLCTISDENRTIKVLDLVNEINRKTKKNYIIENAKVFDAVDVIIALNMFKEGANYIHANNALIYGARNSLTEIVQILGRLLRDAEGKSEVNIKLCIPNNNQGEQDNISKDLNNYLKAIFSVMLIEDLFNIDSKDKERRRSGEHIRYEEFGISAENLLEVHSEVFKALAHTHNNAGKDVWLKVAQTAINNTKYGSFLSEEIQKKLANKIVNIHIKRTFDDFGSLTLISGYTVNDIDYNFINKKDFHPLNWILKTNIINTKTLESLREALENVNIIKDPSKAREVILEIFGHTPTLKEYLVKYKQDNILRSAGLPNYPHSCYNMKWSDFIELNKIQFIADKNIAKEVVLNNFGYVPTYTEYKEKYRKDNILKDSGLPLFITNYYKINWSEFIGKEMFITDRNIARELIFKIFGYKPSLNEYYKRYKQDNTLKDSGLPLWITAYYKTTWAVLFGEEKLNIIKDLKTAREVILKIFGYIPSSNEYKKKYKQDNTLKNLGLPGNPIRYYKKSLWAELFYDEIEKSIKDPKKAKEVILKLFGHVPSIREYLIKYRQDNTLRNAGLPCYPTECYNMKWEEIFGIIPFIKDPSKAREVILEIFGHTPTLKEYLVKYRQDNTLRNAGLPSTIPKYYNITMNEFFGKEKRHMIKDPKIAREIILKIFGYKPSSNEYKKKYKQDNTLRNAGLPSNIIGFYNVNWTELMDIKIAKFLNKNKAREVILYLFGYCPTYTEYRKKYTQDDTLKNAGLPSNPPECYKISWVELMKIEKQYFIRNPKMAREVILKIFGYIPSSTEYYKRYKQDIHLKDSGLPSTPTQFYKIKWSELFSGTFNNNSVK